MQLSTRLQSMIHTRREFCFFSTRCSVTSYLPNLLTFFTLQTCQAKLPIRKRTPHLLLAQTDLRAAPLLSSIQPMGVVQTGSDPGDFMLTCVTTPFTPEAISWPMTLDAL